MTTTTGPSWVMALAEEGLAALDASGGVRHVVHDDRHNSDLFWCTGGDGQRVVVKRGRNWSESSPHELRVALVRIRDRLGDHGEPVVVPLPLAAGGSPPAICMTVVEGTPAKRLMRAEVDAGRYERVHALARLSGTALAWYHDVHLPEVDAAAVAEAARAFDAMRSTRLLHRVRATPAVEPHHVSFSWNDFGFHNVLVTPDDRACLLDVPPTPEPKVVHRDVARGLAELFERYRRRQGPWIPKARRSEVAAAFLAGYRSVSGRGFEAPPDRALLEFHETQAKIRRARRKVKERAWLDAAPAVAVAAQAYWGLARQGPT